MKRQDVTSLLAFLAVAREQNFSRAAASLGISQSALSHSVRQFEERMGVRLLARTTRSVSTTDAGEQLLSRVGPLLEEMAVELEAVSSLGDRPRGTIRIAAGDYQLRCYLWPKLKPFLRAYPEISVEITVDYGLQDIVAERYDAGVRMGDQVEKDMIAVPIGPELRFGVVGAAGYLGDHPAPLKPEDLIGHKCINLRLPSYGGNYAWELEENGKEVSVRVSGQVTFDNIHDVLQAAIDGFGLAYVPLELAEPHLQAGELVQVLSAFTPLWPGFNLYCPSRRQHSQAFALLIEALRHKA